MLDVITGLTIRHGPMLGYKIHVLWKLVILGFAIFWIVMLFNCLQRKFKVDIDKIAWILVLVFIPVVGAFVYLFWLKFGFKKNKK
jgi:hypothetical protein